MTRLRHLALAAAVIGGPARAEVSFSREIQPLFDANCVACHQQGAAQMGLVLEEGAAWSMLVQRTGKGSPLALVRPGVPQESYLLHKLAPEAAKPERQGAQMPPSGPLAASDIDLVRRWIVEGANNN